MRKADFCQKKILPNNFLPNFLITFLGSIIFRFILNNQSISSHLSLFLIILAYLITGVGVIGLLRWFLIKIFMGINYLCGLFLRAEFNIKAKVIKDKIYLRLKLIKKSS